MFADILKNLRTSRNLSQEDLAHIIGISKSTIGMYEQGNRVPKADATLRKLAEFFNVSIDYLMGFEISSAQKKRHIENDALKENVVVYCRDGKTTEVKLTKEKMDIVIKMIDAIKDEDVDL